MTRFGPLLLVLTGLACSGCDATSEGREAWRAGLPAEAHASFEQEAEAAGDAASPELLYDLALAALQVGEVARADAAVRRAAARGGARFEALAAFVRGNVAFAHSEDAEAESLRPDGDPKAFEAAIALAEDAVARWRVAATSRADWSEARRNVERGLERLDRLRERKRVGPKGEGRPKPRPGPPPPPPPSPPVEPDRTTAEDAEATVATAELPDGEVLAVLDRLREKEREKQALRRAERRKRSRDVERDW